MTVIKGTSGYHAHAQALAEQYEGIKFTDIYRDILHFFPSSPKSILDVGAGSGRDSANLAGAGHRVVAVEPTDELRAEGMRRHTALSIDWVSDYLPGLEEVKKRCNRYDLILLTAVWMHLDAGERIIAMRSISQLLNVDGKVVMTLRHGPVPSGRVMFDVSSSETVELARSNGLESIYVGEREDMLGRDDIAWSFLVFRLITVLQ